MCRHGSLCQNSGCLLHAIVGRAVLIFLNFSVYFKLMFMNIWINIWIKAINRTGRNIVCKTFQTIMVSNFSKWKSHFTNYKSKPLISWVYIFEKFSLGCAWLTGSLLLFQICAYVYLQYCTRRNKHTVSMFCR